MHVSMQSMLDHMVWADRRVLELLQTSASSGAGPQALRLLAHVVAAERVWLLRLRGEDSGTHPIWPDWNLDQLAVMTAESAQAYQHYVSALAEADDDRLVDYRNSQGVAFRTSMADILTHVMLHGSYHRGQIASLLRGAEVTPINTDFITFVRERS